MKIKAYTSKDEGTNTHFYHNFTVIDEIMEAGTEDNGWVYTDIRELSLDPEQGNDDVYNFRYYVATSMEIPEDDDDDPVTIDEYFAVPIERDESFKGKLQELREDMGLTQKDVWSTLEIPSRTYESWEMGEKEPAAWVQKLVLDAIDRM